MTTQTIEVNKSNTGWSVITKTFYDKFPNPMITSTGGKSLYRALLWSILEAGERDVKVTDIVINGKKWTNKEAFEKLMTKDNPDYWIKYIKNALSL